MSDSTPDPPSPDRPSSADALRAEIASTRAELARAAELLQARLARRPRPDDLEQPADEAAVPEAEAAAFEHVAPEPDPEQPVVAEPVAAEPRASTRQIIREPAVISDRIEILPAPGRNLPALRPAVAQRGVVAGLALAAVVYLLTRRRRRF